MINLNFFREIRKLSSFSTIFNISGESGTGKTSLALQLVEGILSNDESCIWIQASEKFPNLRLSQLYEEKMLQEIQDKIYVIPKGRQIQTYLEQTHIIQNLTNPDTELPPDTKMIVIDNISYHLRFEVGIRPSIEGKCNMQNRFYEEQLFPLISLCNLKSINLILIHEVTYDPSIDCTRPFFYKLYDRLEGVEILLLNKFRSKNKEMKIVFNGSHKLFSYDIEQSGIVIH